MDDADNTHSLDGVDDAEWLSLYNTVEASEEFKDLCRDLKQNKPSTDSITVSADDGMGDCEDRFDDGRLVLLGKSLAGNTHLKNMTINVRRFLDDEGEVDFEKDLSDDGVEEFISGMTKTQLQHVTFAVYDPIWFQFQLFPGLRAMTTLQSLSIYNTCPIAIANLCEFLAPNNADLSQGATTTATNQCRAQIDFLCLCECLIPYRQLGNLALALPKETSVRKLSLGANNIDDEMISVFAENWSSDSPIQELDLVLNRIGSLGATNLMNKVVDLHALQKLNLGGNRDIGYDGLAAIGNALGLTQLRYLHLGECVSKDQAKAAMAASTSSWEERERAFQALAQGVRNNTNLEKLVLMEGGVHADGAMLIIEATANHPSMIELDLSWNDQIGFHGLQRVGEFLPNVTLQILLLGCCAEWHPPAPTSENEDEDDEEEEEENIPIYQRQRRQTYNAEVTLDTTEAKRTTNTALLQGMVNNFYLYDFHTHSSWDSWQTTQSFYLDLNRNGQRRKILRGPQPLPASFWPHMLAQWSTPSDYHDNNFSRIYYYLREQPGLISTSSIQVKKKRKLDNL